MSDIDVARQDLPQSFGTVEFQHVGELRAAPVCQGVEIFVFHGLHVVERVTEDLVGHCCDDIMTTPEMRSKCPGQKMKQFRENY